MKPIEIDLSPLMRQFGISAQQVDLLTEVCLDEVSSVIYMNWETLAKRSLNSTLPEYIANLKRFTSGKFSRQIILTGVLPTMLENGASPFDIKEGFEKSQKVKYTLPRYNAKGKMIYPGGDWYLTVPFRVGVPGTLGQAGFTGQMPQDIYDLMVKRSTGNQLSKGEIPSPYDQRGTREAIPIAGTNQVIAEYQHKHSIYEGLEKRSAAYNKVVQNTYGTFRRAGKNSDPLSWYHKGLQALKLAEKAIAMTDVETIVENEVTNYLDKIL
jgi:hypothetical protein